MLQAGCLDVILKVCANEWINEFASKINLIWYYDDPSKPWEVCACALACLSLSFLGIYHSGVNIILSSQMQKSQKPASCLEASRNHLWWPSMSLGEGAGFSCSIRQMHCTWFQIQLLIEHLSFSLSRPLYLTHLTPAWEDIAAAAPLQCFYYFVLHILLDTCIHTRLQYWLLMLVFCLGLLCLFCPNKYVNLAFEQRLKLRCNTPKWLQNQWLSVWKGALTSYF